MEIILMMIMQFRLWKVILLILKKRKPNVLPCVVLFLHQFMQRVAPRVPQDVPLSRNQFFLPVVMLERLAGWQSVVMNQTTMTFYHTMATAAALTMRTLTELYTLGKILIMVHLKKNNWNALIYVANILWHMK